MSELLFIHSNIYDLAESVEYSKGAIVSKVIKKNENVNLKLSSNEKIWPDKAMGGIISYLHNIVRCFEKIQGKLPFNSLEQKIQFILDKAVL